VDDEDSRTITMSALSVTYTVCSLGISNKHSDVSMPGHHS